MTVPLPIDCNVVMGVEEQDIAHEVEVTNPIVVVRCREAVVRFHELTEIFAGKRNILAQAFSATCVRDLGNTFIVP